MRRKLSTLYQQALRIDITLFACGPNPIVLVVHRRIYVKVLLVGEKDLLDL